MGHKFADPFHVLAGQFGLGRIDIVFIKVYAELGIPNNLVHRFLS
jgi:hypothetical protein